MAILGTNLGRVIGRKPLAEIRVGLKRAGTVIRNSNCGEMPDTQQRIVSDAGPFLGAAQHHYDFVRMCDI